MKSPLDVSKLFAKAQQMQSKVAQLQQELARRSFEGSAGGGMVTAVATGDLRVVEIRLDVLNLCPLRLLPRLFEHHEFPLLIAVQLSR